ncbi:hypothetical protein PoB_001114400 [Plakobranchus ocellatus]|uniref:Uncharacterized protein n=1 Tax=Plakobranchus ocellatus TaxID=259542 RepID=A0AAV3YRN9_9GAST|nr:hypothetical protein PoB_001114400 [Plakobranchus ocellatus]
MSDSLPTISADQLTKAVNLAAAGTLPPIDGEAEDEQPKGETFHQDGQNKSKEPSSPLPTLKLLEALSSSMSPNLSRLGQLDLDKYPAHSFPSIRDINSKGRQRALPPVPSAPAPPRVRKYSNRKNYKLLPPIIPGQIGAGLRKMKPCNVQQKQQLVNLGNRLKSVSSGSVQGFQVRPVSTSFVLVRPSSSPAVSGSVAMPSTQLGHGLKGPNVSASHGYQLHDRNMKPVPPLPVISQTSLGSQLIKPNTSHISSKYVLSNLQAILREKATNEGQRVVLQALNPTKENEIITPSTICPKMYSCVSKEEQCSRQSTCDVLTALTKSPITHDLSLRNRSPKQASTLTMSISSLGKTQASSTSVAATPPKLAAEDSKSLAPAVSKPVYVPILPQPVATTLPSNLGQLVIQNSCLQMIHPNGSLQTIAILHAPTSNSSSLASGQAPKPPLSFCNILKPPSGHTMTITSGSVDNHLSSRNNISSNADESCFQTKAVISCETATDSALKSSNFLVSTNCPSSQGINHLTEVSKGLSVSPNIKAAPKTVLATVIARPRGLIDAQRVAPCKVQLQTHNLQNLDKQFWTKQFAGTDSLSNEESPFVFEHRKTNNEVSLFDRHHVICNKNTESKNSEVSNSSQSPPPSIDPLISFQHSQMKTPGSIISTSGSKFVSQNSVNNATKPTIVPNHYSKLNIPVDTIKEIQSSSQVWVKSKASFGKSISTHDQNLDKQLNSSQNLSTQHKSDSICSLSSEQTAINESVAAAAMMSLAQTAEYRYEMIEPQTGQVSSDVNLQSVPGPQALLQTSFATNCNSVAEVSKGSPASVLMNGGFIPSITSPKTSEELPVRLQKENDPLKSLSAPPSAEPQLCRTAQTISPPLSIASFSGDFLVPSLCGKKMVVSPGGIKHLQSLLRQRGISEGYFVITSPRAVYSSSTSSTSKAFVPATSSAQLSSVKVSNIFEDQISKCLTPRQNELIPKPGQEENNSKPESNNRGVCDETEEGLRARDDDNNIDSEDTDNTSCTSRSSSAALVIETGEEEEDKEGAYQSTINSQDRSTRKPVLKVKESKVTTDFGSIISKVPQADKRDEAKDALCSDESTVGKLSLHDNNSSIPQSPLSLGDLIRQQASKNSLLRKQPDCTYLKSPEIVTRDVPEALRAPTESNNFALPLPISHSATPGIQQYPQSTLESDMASDYRQNVFTPVSMFPVDLSYERDSQLASVRNNEAESTQPFSPPKVAVSSTNVSSPKSPFMVSSSVADHVTALNPPMTPNTMLINLLNRVPTPLLTNNQDILTLPTSQESGSKINRAIPEKRGEHLYTLNDNHEYSDNLTDAALFPDNRKSIDSDHESFGPPQNALEMIASNYTPSRITNENTSNVVSDTLHFTTQTMARESIFGKPPFGSNLQEEYDSSFYNKMSPKKMCQDTLSCCDHLLVTVNLDSEAPAYAVPVPHSHGQCVKTSQPLAATHNINCAHNSAQTRENLPRFLGISNDEKALAAQQTGKVVDTDILRHLIMSTSTASYNSQSSVGNLPGDSAIGGFSLMNQQHGQPLQCHNEQHYLSHFPCNDNRFLHSQDKGVPSNNALTDQSSNFTNHAEAHFSSQAPCQTLCTLSDTNMSYKKAVFHCTVPSSQIQSTVNLQNIGASVGNLHNVPFMPDMQDTSVGRFYNTAENLNKQNLPHNFIPTEEHLQQITQESEAYFNHSQHEISLQAIRHDSDHPFQRDSHQALGSYEHNQNMQSFGQNNRQHTLPSVFEESDQTYEHTGQSNLEAYDQSGQETGLQVFNPRDHQQSSMQGFDISDHGNHVHSFHTAKQQPNMQSYDQQPDSRDLSYSMESLPPAAAPPPPEPPYPSPSMSHQGSSGIFSSHSDQVNFLVNQQYPPHQPPYFASSTAGGTGSSEPALFSEQCAIGSEAPVLGRGSTHPCNEPYNDTPQGLQHLPQQYPFPANPSSSNRGDISGSQHHHGHAEEEESNNLEKQPVLPSASFSPPSVADQAANQAAVAAAEAGAVGHQYTGPFPNLSIYDLYLRGSNAEARGGPPEAEPLSGNFCVECNTMYKTQCKFHSCDYTYVTDTPILSHARLTLPSCLLLKESTVIGHTNNTGMLITRCSISLICKSLYSISSKLNESVKATARMGCAKMHRI